MGSVPCKRRLGFYRVFVVGFSPKNREAAPLITLLILQGFVKNSVIRISPGCAGSISSRSHLLIVVCGGRGWKFNLGFGLHSCKANSYYLNCIYSILFGREIAWSHCVRLVTHLFKLLLMLVIGRIKIFSRPCLSTFFIKKKAITDTTLMRPSRA